MEVRLGEEFGGCKLEVGAGNEADGKGEKEGEKAANLKANYSTHLER
jgi:hypothetical protein